MGKGITRKRINAKRNDSGGGGGAGTVTNIATTGPITGGPITVTGTIGFDQTANFTWSGQHDFTVTLPTSSIIPTNGDDLVNKTYVDSLVAGLSPQPSVVVATLAPLPACTPAGAGIGKTLTMDAVGILTVDGVATVLGDSILVKDQVDAADNGVYTVTTEGTGGVTAVLTRRSNYDETSEVLMGTFFGVSQGTQAGTVWVMVSPNPVVVDTDDIIFSFFFLGTSPDLDQVLTVGNTSDLSIVLDDGLGVTSTYSPGSITATAGAFAINSTGFNVMDSTASYPMLALDASTGLAVLGDYTGFLGTPYIGVDGASNTAFMITNNGGLQAVGTTGQVTLTAPGELFLGGDTSIYMGHTGGGGYNMPILDGNPNYVLTTDGAGAASWQPAAGGASIVPLTAAALLALAGTFDTEVVYQVTDAGEGTAGVTGVLNIRAQDISNLQPYGQGYFINDYTGSNVYAMLGYSLATNEFVTVIEPIRNNKVYCSFDPQSLILDTSAIEIFHFDDDDWRDNTINNVIFDNAGASSSNGLIIKGCNWETAWFDFQNHSDIEFINTSFKGVANQLSGVPDLVIDGDTVSFECNDFYGNDSDYGVQNVGNGADITYVRLGWFSTVDMNSIVNADLRFSNIGSTAYVDINTDQAVRYCEFGNGTTTELTGLTLRCNFFSGDQGSTTGVSGFKGSNSTLTACSYGGGTDLTCNDSNLYKCTVTGGTGTGNLIRSSNLSNCTVNFANFSNCTVINVTGNGTTITFTADGQVVGGSNILRQYANDAARDATITKPIEGMTVVSNNLITFYSGGAWVTA